MPGGSRTPQGSRRKPSVNGRYERQRQRECQRQRRAEQHQQQRDNDQENQPPQQPPNRFIGRRFPPQFQTYSVGQLSIECEFCNALRFLNERANCCHNGKVMLQPLKPYPPELEALFTNDDGQSKNFKSNIRNYNSAMAFASFGAQVVSPSGHGPYTFRIHGQIYHQSGPLHPP